MPAALPGQRIDELCAHAVGVLGEAAHGGTGLLADPVGEGQKRAGLRVLHRGIAQQHCLAFARQQRVGDRLGLVARFGLDRRGHALGRRDRRCDGCERMDPGARCGGHRAGQRHRPVVVHRMQAVNARALLRRLAQALGEQRMVLAQEGADH
jgi:hypothetical protein